MKNAKKNGFSKFIAVVLAILSIVMPTVGVYADEIIEPSGQAAGIQNGASYMIKNAASGKYLTLPGYFDVEYDGKNNVYQSSAKVNDQYSRAVTVTYGTAAEKYNISPLLFQGIVTGGLKNDGSGNVVYGETATVEYNWAIEKVNVTQYRIYSGGFALTSYGNANGSVDSSGTNVAGNIYLATVDQNSVYQLWTFESVTVNPHMLKNTDITKKNLGTGAEWLFQLGSGEMAANSGININSVSFSNSTIVRAAIFGGKRVIVKLSDDTSTPDDRSDDYTVMTFNLNTGVKRIAVVQDAGTGSGDACLTWAFENETVFREFVLADGLNSEYILTFKSTLGNVKIKKWELVDGVGGVEFSKSQNKMLTGDNFAIVKMTHCGFMVVKATSETNVVYIMVIEVKELVDDKLYRDVNSLSLDESKNFELIKNEKYLIPYHGYYSTIKSIEVKIGTMDILYWGKEFILFQTGNEVSPAILEVCVEDKYSSTPNETIYTIAFKLKLSGVIGECYTMQFSEGGELYLAVDKNDDEPYVFISNDISGTYWRFSPQGGGTYIIYSMDKAAMNENGRALGLKNGKIVHLDVNVANMKFLLWEIEMENGVTPGVTNAVISHYTYLDSYLCLKNGANGTNIVTIDDEPHTWYLEKPNFDDYHSGWYTGLQRNEDGKFIIYYDVDDNSISSSMGEYNAYFIKEYINEVIESWNLDKFDILFVRVTDSYQRPHITFRMKTNTEYDFLGIMNPFDSTGTEIEDALEMGDNWYRAEVLINRISSDNSDERIDIADYIESDPDYIRGIIAHELGHALKLDHVVNSVGSSVMRTNNGDELYVKAPTYYDYFTLRAKLRNVI